jgi:hypothetical protein
MVTVAKSGTLSPRTLSLSRSLLQVALSISTSSEAAAVPGITAASAATMEAAKAKPPRLLVRIVIEFMVSPLDI